MASGRGNDGGSVLVVVHDGDREGFAQDFLNVEALGGFDVLEVDSADGGFEELAEFDDVFRILGIDFAIENVNVGEALEEDPFALHHRRGGQGADISQTQHGRAVADDRDEIAPRSVFEGEFGQTGDIETRLGDTGRIGQAQVPLRAAGLRRDDFDFAVTAVAVVIERVFFGNDHRHLPLSACTRLRDTFGLQGLKRHPLCRG